MDKTFTFTFGDFAENHVGMQQIGKKGDEEKRKKGTMTGGGLTLEELKIVRDVMEKRGLKCIIYDLGKLLLDLEKAEDHDAAYILIVKNYLSKDKANKLYIEQNSIEWDKRFWNARMKKVQNKRARYNLVYSDKAQTAEFEKGKGTIVPWDAIPNLRAVRDDLSSCGVEKMEGMVAEGNAYYNNTTGIGWHGDAERELVVALMVGKPMSLCYNWWFQHRSKGPKFETTLRHGDLYLMSAKAVGTDWMKKNIWTLRHSAGNPKYTKITK